MCWTGAAEADFAWLIGVFGGGPVNTGVGLTDMYRIPKDLDLSPVVGEFTTQLRVGQFDLQFTFGPVNFAVQSPVNIFRDGKLVAHWEEGK